LDDLAIIIVSTNEGRWLRPCLESIFRQAGDIALDVVVADNESTDDTVAVVESFDDARVVPCQNHGFAHANNRGYLTSSARYTLFLNPDTEIVQGTFAELVRDLDARPEVGLAGVRQLDGDGDLFPTIRRFPSLGRAFGDALGLEKLPWRAKWLGERELDSRVYERETEVDWTSGSFMCTRSEALAGAGLMDERLFLYGEEPDLCLRMKQAGWEIRHLPTMTIIHHADKAGMKPKLHAQFVYAQKQFARKHWGRSRRTIWFSLLFFRDRAQLRRQTNGAAVATLLGRREAPFEPPPSRSLRPVHAEQRELAPAGHADSAGSPD
jgi:GT2 family glycosyltransferase